jgi:hypothetical protein
MPSDLTRSSLDVNKCFYSWDNVDTGDFLTLYVRALRSIETSGTINAATQLNSQKCACSYVTPMLSTCTSNNTALTATKRKSCLQGNCEKVGVYLSQTLQFLLSSWYCQPTCVNPRMFFKVSCAWTESSCFVCQGRKPLATSWTITLCSINKSFLK